MRVRIQTERMKNKSVRVRVLHDYNIRNHPTLIAFPLLPAWQAVGQGKGGDAINSPLLRGVDSRHHSVEKTGCVNGSETTIYLP